jgi:hypothetical protein
MRRCKGVDFGGVGCGFEDGFVDRKIFKKRRRGSEEESQVA